jgi:hypothetical protein
MKELKKEKILINDRTIGKIIKNDSTFLISDCYYLNGEDMHAIELKTKSFNENL